LERFGDGMQRYRNMHRTFARRSVWVLCAGLPLLAGGCGSPDGDLEPASEAAAAVTIPCIGVPAGDATAYTEKRVFLESQGWWGERKADGVSVPKYGAAEHIHVGMCFPVQQTVSGTRPFKVRVLGHNLPVGSIIESTLLHDPDGGTFVRITWNRTITSSDNNTVELWGTAQINTALFSSGTREFRNLTTVKRPDNAELHASSGWCWKPSNGGTLVNSGTCATLPLTTMGRGWYDCFEYKIAEAREWAYPFTGIASNTNYTLNISGRDGAGPNNLVTGWEVRLDPDFHNGINGSLIASGSGPTVGRSVTISGSLLTTGVHKLVVIGFANAKCTTGAGITPQDGELSAVMAIPIKVN
jgi:hypothetical protein